MEDEQIQSSSESNAFGPLQELNTPLEWSDWLHANAKGFKGNLTNAGLLMSEFVAGRNYVIDKLNSKNLKGFERPKVVILTDDFAAPSPIGSALGGHASFVKQSFLEEYSLLDMYATTTVTRADGEVAFHGTIPDMFRLAGVEETHHGVFEQIKKDIPSGVNPLSSSIAEYDAKEIEYRALKWQIRYAKEHHLPEHTINRLKERLEAARTIRTDLKNENVHVASVDAPSNED